jgi:predicted hydrocarbon binding protein
MTTNEERMQVLKMIEKGQITADEGARLLEAIEAASAKGQAEGSPTSPRWFRVHVTDLRTGKSKVNVNIPMGLVNVGMRMGAKFAPEMNGVDVEKLVQAIKEGVHGKVIDVEDEEGGEHVEIYVE